VYKLVIIYTSRRRCKVGTLLCQRFQRLGDQGRAIA